VQLTQEVQREEPITLKIYRFGEILDPDGDKNIFFGRDDLKNPNWDNYFIHAMPLQVDYLKPQDATRLITESVDLNYPDTVIEPMLEVTQGHPALLQMPPNSRTNTKSTTNNQ